MDNCFFIDWTSPFPGSTAIVASNNVVLSSIIDGGYGLPCTTYTPVGGCIPADFGLNLSAFPNYLRASYFNYGTKENLAFSVVNNVGSATGSTIAWTVATRSNFQAGSTVAMSNVALPPYNLFAASLMWSCRESLYMSMVGSIAGGPIANFQTYRLATDPATTMRIPVNPPPEFYSTNGDPHWGMSMISDGGPKPRQYLSVQPLANGSVGIPNRISNETVVITWTAQDVCMTMQQCQQTVNLNTLTECANVLS